MAKTPKPPKSPYHHLIPEIRDQRRRRIWYSLLAVAIGVFGWIAYSYQRMQKGYGSRAGGGSPIAQDRIERAVRGTESGPVALP